MKTDKELLDFLQSLNDKQGYTGRSVLRESRTSRGWGLQESTNSDANENVRESISKYMDQTVISKCTKCRCVKCVGENHD